MNSVCNTLIFLSGVVNINHSHCVKMKLSRATDKAVVTLRLITCRVNRFAGRRDTLFKSSRENDMELSIFSFKHRYVVVLGGLRTANGFQATLSV